eukprot:SAG31_NODE_14489_length_803_cov_2.088068_1_plen_267_part_11
MHRGKQPELAAGVDWVSPTRKDEPVPASVKTIKGTFKAGAQRHFYMETQSTCAVPVEGGRWDIYSSDQDANFTQQSLSMMLGVPAHHITVHMMRAGGGFGGKISRQMLPGCAAAVAANKLRRPVRIQNERSDDLQMTAGREAMEFDYTVTFDADTGRLQEMDMQMTIDPGWFYGDSNGCMAMAVGWSDNVYSYKTFKVTPKAALTDTPHSTAMRAPGCMQSILASEVVLGHVASEVGKPLEEVQALNFYDPSAHPDLVTPFGDHIGQ